MTLIVARKTKLSHKDYERLLEFRTGLRTFLAWSQREASKVGLGPTQHQLLLAIRGHRDHERGPTVGEVAGYLLVKPHSAAELVTRAQDAGLVDRRSDPDDRRVVRLGLTGLGEQKLESITEATLEELARLGPRLRSVWKGLDLERSRSSQWRGSKPTKDDAKRGRVRSI